MEITIYLICLVTSDHVEQSNITPYIGSRFLSQDIPSLLLLLFGYYTYNFIVLSNKSIAFLKRSLFCFAFRMTQRRLQASKKDKK